MVLYKRPSASDLGLDKNEDKPKRYEHVILLSPMGTTSL
jgi:hypothetical protein